MREAHDSFDTALKICRARKTAQTATMGGGRRGGGRGGRGGGGGGRGDLGLSEVASVYLDLVAVLTKLGKQVQLVGGTAS